ncbi:ATP-binding protein [Bosea sp. TWI1241]|uniref:ATP-binding protein n=1 Tax=Bosea sp. TWI1241 TaxID=3148904 RepID=UPI0032080D8A
MAQLVPTDEGDLTKVDASPTKAFFVEIITKDIQLDEAIQDLVDNCIDGAKRLRPGSDANYNGLRVSIELNAQGFVIEDNCGGIPLDIARKYAFKFGRAKGFKRTSHSVGQFGVGMKRALFKMGDLFSVSSTEPEHSFRIEVDVPTWANDDTNWDFDITELVDRPYAVEQTGTRIQVSNLDPAVATTFSQAGFVTKLRHDIRVVQQHPMRLGLQISLNGQAIIPTEWQLKEGAGIAPAFRQFEDDLGGDSPLSTRLYAGVGESSRAHAGWYVFCNGRCILEADQEATTGWSELSDDGVGVPKYHGQFARFRGYAFLDSDDSRILPWNTTKTGLDLESDAYRRLRGRLIEITRPVIDFLNNLDAEKDLEETDKILTHALAKAAPVALERLVARPVFVYTPQPRRGPPLARISFQKPKAEADRLKEALSAQSNPDLGAKAFEYAYANLIEED